MSSNDLLQNRSLFGVSLVKLLLQKIFLIRSLRTKVLIALLVLPVLFPDDGINVEKVIVIGLLNDAINVAFCPDDKYAL